jgi:hypothetical protein
MLVVEGFYQVHRQAKNAQQQKKFEANSSVQGQSLEADIIMSKEEERKRKSCQRLYENILSLLANTCIF